LSIIASSALAAGLFAQAPAPKIPFPDASPASSLKQRVGATDIEINYNRPNMKGRAIFGHLVPYGQIWRTGANNATKITFSTAVKLNGTEVPAGTYEIFTIPGESEWTVIIHQNKSQWGSYAYDAKNDVARVKATPVALPIPVESLTFNVNNLASDSATLDLRWENTCVPVRIEVDVVGQLKPQIEQVMAGEGKKPYFQAAMFYFENNLDLKQAIAWMDAGLAEKPDAFWMLYRKGLILAKMGDKAGAVAAAEQSIALVEKQKGELRDEYLRLNRALIDSQR
jgi:tetratricopeptide (TPR) repeat protein